MKHKVKIKVSRHQEDGSYKKVTEEYIVDSLSCTEAETRIIDHANEGDQEIEVKQVSNANISDIFEDNGGIWYKAKVSFCTIDENVGKESKVNQYMLVQAEDFQKALSNILEQFKGFTVPYEIHSLTETKINDYIKYGDNS